jgi:hypothetical protein
LADRKIGSVKAFQWPDPWLASYSLFFFALEDEHMGLLDLAQEESISTSAVHC